MFIDMKTHVRRWGNSIGVRIPKIMAEEVGIVDGTELEMKVVDDKIVLSKPTFSLEDLVSKITPENMYPETDWGDPIGKELW